MTSLQSSIKVTHDTKYLRILGHGGHRPYWLREHVKILTLDENVNRLTFEPDPPPPKC